MRTRKLVDLRSDARKRADVEGATDRHPDVDVTRYVNEGYSELYDLLVEIRGRTYFRKNPPKTITTVGGDTTRYALGVTDFYQLISVRRDGDMGYNLRPFEPQDEPLLRMTSAAVDSPSHYELQGEYIELLPKHAAGVNIIVEYVPCITDLVGDNDTVDGVDGWEKYIIAYAARCMADKDEEWDVVRSCENEMAQLRKRIEALAPQRDRFRTERVKDVRGGALPFWWFRR